MEKRNINFTADGGMRVGVKELKTEDYSGKTQDYLVKAWNYSSWPGYKSRLWNKENGYVIRLIPPIALSKHGTLVERLGRPGLMLTALQIRQPSQLKRHPLAETSL